MEIQKIYLEVPTDISASVQVLSWFEQINQPPIYDKIFWWKCQTILIEGFTNIVEHAHKDFSIETPIELEVTRYEKNIEIRIFSFGKPFNIKQKLKTIPELDNNYNERGRGLKIINAIADELSYEVQSDNRCCLFISKRV